MLDEVFFDANGDGFVDLYVVSGGYGNYAPDDLLLQDRFYLNDGKGTPQSIMYWPAMYVSKVVQELLMLTARCSDILLAEEWYPVIILKRHKAFLLIKRWQRAF